MGEAPRFSVLIPAYNAQDTLVETIESVRAQTFEDFEIVIVDDGSSDGTSDIMERFAYLDRRIIAVHQENRGTAGAYNEAFRHASSDHLVMLSADDLLLPEHLASFDRLIAENPDATVFTSDGFYLFDDGSRVPVRPSVGWADASSCALTDLLERCFYGVGAVFHRSVFQTVGGFAEGMYAEDYLFWLMASAHGFIHRYLDEPLSLHRVTDAAKSADHLTMRASDVATIEAVVDSGLLDDVERAAAERSIARLKRNIGVRRLLGATFGRGATERIISALHRGRGARKE